MSGFLDSYNFHDWSKFMVSPKNKPAGPHFAAVLFDTRREYVHDHYDPENSSSVTKDELVYFAFPDKETLESWLFRATKDDKKFFFFEVAKLGEVSTKINVGL